MGTARDGAMRGTTLPDPAFGLRNHIPLGAPATREPVEGGGRDGGTRDGGQAQAGGP